MFSHSVMSDSLQLYGLHHARIPCPSPSHGACLNSCPLGWWCYPTISSSVAALNLSQHQRPFQWAAVRITWPKYCSFTSASVLPMNIQDGFSLGLNSNWKKKTAWFLFILPLSLLRLICLWPWRFLCFWPLSIFSLQGRAIPFACWS